MDHWVDEVIEPRRAPNTTKSYRTRIRMDITPVIGAVPLDRLRPSHVRMVENRILRGDGRTGTDPRSAAPKVSQSYAMSDMMFPSLKIRMCPCGTIRFMLESIYPSHR